MSIVNYRVVTIDRVPLKANGDPITQDSDFASPHTFQKRIVPVAANAHTSDSPTLETYLERELADGRSVVYRDQEVLVTGQEEYSATGSVGAKALSQANVSEVMVALSTSCRGVLIFPHPSNTGRVWIGIGSAVKYQGGWLNPTSGPLPLPVADLNTVYVLAEVQGEGVTYLAKQ